jgi:predicted nucleic acid-binding Zn ribbon protein
MFCYKCGKEMGEGDKFCNSCGAVVGGGEKKNYWRYLSYAWTVIINLITVGVVFAIYGSVYASFETIVVSLLILIYLSLQGSSMIYSTTTAETAFALDAEFKRIRKLLKDEPDEYENEKVQEAKKKVDKAMVKMYINAGFLLIIYLIALFHLFGALQ